MKPRSKKPTSPPSVAVLPATGDARIEQEDLPTDFEAIEATVAERFVQVLRQHGYDASYEGRPHGDRPDALLKVDGKIVAVELVEVVDGKHRANGGGQWLVDDRLLERTVAAKAAKGYVVEPTWDALWLLAWVSSTYSVGQYVADIPRLVQEGSSQFSEAWLLSLLPSPTFGSFIDRLYPMLLVSGTIDPDLEPGREIITLELSVGGPPPVVDGSGAVEILVMLPPGGDAPAP